MKIRIEGTFKDRADLQVALEHIGHDGSEFARTLTYRSARLQFIIYNEERLKESILQTFADGKSNYFSDIRNRLILVDEGVIKEALKELVDAFRLNYRRGRYYLIPAQPPSLSRKARNQASDSP